MSGTTSLSLINQHALKTSSMCSCAGRCQLHPAAPHLEGRSGMYSNAMSSRKPVMESRSPSTTTTADASTGRYCRDTKKTQSASSCTRCKRVLLKTAVAERTAQQQLLQWL